MEEKKFPGRMLKSQMKWENSSEGQPDDKLNEDEESLILNRIESSMKKRDFCQVYKLIQNGKFSDNLRVIDLWDAAHYAEKEMSIRRPLTPLMRFRIRQRYPPPPNICPSGVRKTLSLPLRAKVVLDSWYESHKDNPFPTRGEKESLSKQSGLTLTQVQTWFANLRRRKLKSCKEPEDYREQGTPNHQLSSETSSDFISNFNRASNSRWFNYDNYPFRISNEAQSHHLLPLDLSSSSRSPNQYQIEEPNARLQELLSDPGDKSHVARDAGGNLKVCSGPSSISPYNNFVERAVSFYVKAAAIAFPGYLNPSACTRHTNIDHNQPRQNLALPGQFPYYWRPNIEDNPDSPQDLRLPVVRNRSQDL